MKVLGDIPQISRNLFKKITMAKKCFVAIYFMAQRGLGLWIKLWMKNKAPMRKALCRLVGVYLSLNINKLRSWSKTVQWAVFVSYFPP